MRLLIVRHAEAEDRERFGSDVERPLTAAGRHTARQAGRALAELVPRLDALASSPLIRARDTARLLAAERGELTAIELDELRPGAPRKALLAWLAAHGRDASVGLVGHEPDLSRLASWFVTGHATSALALKKAGACLIDFPARPGAGEGQLLWLLSPAIWRHWRA